MERKEKERKKERDSMTEFWGTASFRAQGHKEKKQSRGQRKSHQREREKKYPGELVSWKPREEMFLGGESGHRSTKCW